MIFTVQFKVEVNDEYAPYQRDKVADMMQNLEGIIEWDIIDEQKSEGMIFTVRFSIRIDNEFAPYQEDEVYDLMDIIGMNKGFLGWRLIKVEKEEDDEDEDATSWEVEE